MVGLYDLWVEGNLGLTGNAEYGYDTVGLGYPGEGGVTLNKQTVGAMAAPDFNFGHFGIDPKSTNFTNFTTEAPSFMTSLRTQNLIPSVSWGYTAGAPYRGLYQLSKNVRRMLTRFYFRLRQNPRQSHTRRVRQLALHSKRRRLPVRAG